MELGRGLYQNEGKRWETKIVYPSELFSVALVGLRTLFRVGGKGGPGRGGPHCLMYYLFILKSSFAYTNELILKGCNFLSNCSIPFSAFECEYRRIWLVWRAMAGKSFSPLPHTFCAFCFDLPTTTSDHPGRKRLAAQAVAGVCSIPILRCCPLL